MGLYNLIFGKNTNADQLLALLGFTQDTFYRFRDCYLEEYRGKRAIAVYTRAGGGNSECWCGEWRPLDPETSVKNADGALHAPDCVTLVNEVVRKHELYAERLDDDFDCTYCTYYFRVPEEAKISEMKMEPDRNAAWLDFFAALREGKSE